MVSRIPYAHALAIFLAAVLAWPSCVPILAMPPATQEHAKGKPKVERRGVGFQNRDRKTVLDEMSWSDLADNFEDTDSRDELYCSTMAFNGGLLDIPSLVPLADQRDHPGSVDRAAPFLLGPHLRC